VYLIDVFRKIDKFAQPVNGKLHFGFAVMSSEVETSVDISKFRNSKRFLDSARNDKIGFMRTGGETANRSGRIAGCLECRTRSWRGDPCRDRKRSLSIFPDRKRCRRAPC